MFFPKSILPVFLYTTIGHTCANHIKNGCATDGAVGASAQFLRIHFVFSFPVVPFKKKTQLLKAYTCGARLSRRRIYRRPKSDVWSPPGITSTPFTLSEANTQIKKPEPWFSTRQVALHICPTRRDLSYEVPTGPECKRQVTQLGTKLKRLPCKKRP